MALLCGICSLLRVIILLIRYKQGGDMKLFILCTKEAIHGPSVMTVVVEKVCYTSIL